MTIRFWEWEGGGGIGGDVLLAFALDCGFMVITPL